MQTQAEKNEFHLKGKIIVVKENVSQTNKDGSTHNTTANLVLVDINESTEKYFFIAKYFPDLNDHFNDGAEYVADPEQVIEVVGVVAHPINKPVRFSVIPESKHIDRPHLMLMSLGTIGEIEEAFVRMIDKDIIFTIVPPNIEDEFGSL